MPIERPLIEQGLADCSEKTLEGVCIGGAPSGGELLTDLVAYWTMNEAANSTRLDSHSNGYDLSDALSGISTMSGKYGNAALSSGGSSNRLTIADASSPLLAFGDEDFSISMWFRATAFVNGYLLLNKWLLGGYQLQVEDTNKLAWNVSSAKTLTPALSTATWYHLAVYHDSVNNQIGLVLNDGTPITAALSGGPDTGNPIPVAFDILGSSGGAYSFDGAAEEVGIWNKVFSPTDITNLYNSGNGLTYADL